MKIKLKNIIAMSLLFSMLLTIFTVAPAVSQEPQRGPEIDRLRFKVIEGAPAYELYVDDFSGSVVRWTTIGSSPYLDAVDYPNNYIESNTYSDVIAFFSFENMTSLSSGEEIKRVTIEAYARSEWGKIDGDIVINYGERWRYAGPIQTTDWSWIILDIYELGVDTPEKINNLRAYIHYWTPDGSSGYVMTIDALRLRVWTIMPAEAQRDALLLRDVDFLPDLMTPEDVEHLAQAGKVVVPRPGLHNSYIGFNLRQPVTGDVNFRHAVYHCFPRDDLIGTIYRYIVTKVNSVVPPALSEWYWPNVWAHDYNPGDPFTSPAWDGIKDSPTETAVGILKYGGYMFHDEGTTPGEVDAGDYWTDPNGDFLPWIMLYSPLYVVSPTSAESAARLIAECKAIGLNNMDHMPYEFEGYIRKVRDEHDFDMYMMSHSMPPHPSYLYNMLHSNEDFLGGDNWPGVHDPEIDAELETIMFGLDHDAKVGACRDLQEMMADATKPYGLAVLPFYSKAYFAAHQPELCGIINMPGYGSDNWWSFINARWTTEDGNRPGTTEKTLIYCNREEPEILNPTSAITKSTRNMMNPIYDSLIARNPYTLGDEPWLATSWTITEGIYTTPGGPAVCKFHFDLRNDVYWHDHDPDQGVNRPFTAEDCVFALNYLKDNEILYMMPVWEKIVYVDKTGTYSFDVYTSEPSQWLIYDFARVCAMFPKHIWQNILDDPITPENEILSYVLTDHPNPTSRYPGLTELVGTGPFVLTYHDPLVYSDLTANRYYWLTTQQIEDRIVWLFHRAGDVNYDGVIDDIDVEIIFLAMWTRPGDPLWNPDADITGPMGTPPDGYINLYDVATAGKFKGETREVCLGRYVEDYLTEVTDEALAEMEDIVDAAPIFPSLKAHMKNMINEITKERDDSLTLLIDKAGDMIDDATRLIRDAKKEDLDVSVAEDLLTWAELEYEREEYEKALRDALLARQMTLNVLKTVNPNIGAEPSEEIWNNFRVSMIQKIDKTLWKIQEYEESIDYYVKNGEIPAEVALEMKKQLAIVKGSMETVRDRLEEPLMQNP